MRRSIRGSVSFPGWVSMIAVGGFIGRVAFLWLSRNWSFLGDGFAYRIDADALLDGRIPGTLHPPLWTFLMALPGLLGFPSLLQQQLLAASIGTATIVMTALACRDMFDDRVGLIAAALVAVYPNIWLYERELLSEPLAMLTVAVTLWLVSRFRSSPSFPRAAALGAVVGVSALVRSELILIAAGIVLPLVLGVRRVPLATRLRWLVVSGLIALALLAPWSVYNATRYERPVLLSTGMGPAMRAGNCPPTYGGELLGYYKFGCVLFGKVSGDPSVSDGEWRTVALRYMGERPGRAAVVALAREGRVFNLYRPFQQARFETERGSALWLTRGALISYWVLLPLAVAGAVLTRKRGVALYPLLAYPLIVALAVLPTIGAVRYRAPAEIVLVIFAAVTIDRLGRRWLANRDRGEEPVVSPTLSS